MPDFNVRVRIPRISLRRTQDETGTRVVANPPGDTGASLTRISIDGVPYKVAVPEGTDAQNSHIDSRIALPARAGNNDRWDKDKLPNDTAYDGDLAGFLTQSQIQALIDASASMVDSLSPEQTAKLAGITVNDETAKRVAGDDVQSVTASSASAYQNTLNSQRTSDQPLLLVVDADISGIRGGNRYSHSKGDVFYVAPRSDSVESLFNVESTAIELSDTAPAKPNDGTGSAGTADSASRSDHRHPLPDHATTTSGGLMSQADKRQVNKITDIEHRTTDLTATQHTDWTDLPNGNNAAFRMVGINQADTLNRASWGHRHQALLANTNYVVEMRIPLGHELAQYRLSVDDALVAPSVWSEGAPDATYRYFGGVGTITAARNKFVEMQSSSRSYHTTYSGDVPPPTRDAQPATKKYVDDNSGGGGEDATARAGVADLQNRAGQISVVPNEFVRDADATDARTYQVRVWPSRAIVNESITVTVAAVSKTLTGQSFSGGETIDVELTGDEIQTISLNLAAGSFALVQMRYGTAQLEAVIPVVDPPIAPMTLQAAVNGVDNAGVTSITLPSNYTDWRDVEISMWEQETGGDRISSGDISTKTLAAQTGNKYIVLAGNPGARTTTPTHGVTWNPTNRTMTRMGQDRIIFAELHN